MESNDFSSVQETDSGSLRSNTNFCPSLPPSVTNVLNAPNQSPPGPKEGEVSHPNESSENGVGVLGGRAMFNTVLPVTPPRHQLVTGRKESNSCSSASLMYVESWNNQQLSKRPKCPEYSSYNARMHSFERWHSTLENTSRQMAEEGFYFDRVSNRARCYCCGETLRPWKPGIDPYREHIQKDCEYARRYCGISSSQHRHEEELYHSGSRGDPENSSIYTRHSNWKDVTKQTSSLRALETNVTGLPASNKSRTGTYLKNDINPELRPKYPNFASFNARIGTFSNWPSTVGIPKERMAEAGFFFTGMSDITRCFHCGESLQRWEPGDDPILQHIHWFPNCEIAQRLAYAQRERHENHIPGQADLTREPECGATVGRVNVPDTINSAAAQAVLDMGYPPETVRDAISKLKEDNGNVPVTGESLITFILDDEEKRAEVTDNQSLLREFEELREIHMCRICLESDRNATLLPCGHLVCCMKCAEGLPVCPMCRSHIDKCVKTFLS